MTKNRKGFDKRPFEEWSLAQLDKLKRNEQFEKMHVPHDRRIVAIANNYGVSEKGIIETIQSVQHRIKTLLKDVRNDKYYLVECTPAWAKERRKPDLVQQVRIEKKEQRKAVKEAVLIPHTPKQQGVFFTIDPKFLPYRLDENERLVRGWDGDVEGVRFAQGTELSKLFPNDFECPPTYYRELQYRLDKTLVNNLAYLKRTIGGSHNNKVSRQELRAIRKAALLNNNSNN